MGSIQKGGGSQADPKIWRVYSIVRPPGPSPIVCSDLFPNRRGLCFLFLDSATSPFGFAQNDSIAGGFEISNANERRIQCFSCGANSTQLGLHFYALHEDGVKGRFSVISHHIERRDT